MRKIRIGAFTLFLLFALLSVAGCAAGKNEATQSSDGSFNGGSILYDAADYDGYSYNKTTSPTEDSATGSSTGDETGIEGQFERKIIKTVRINGETKAFDTATGSIDAYIAKYSGYIETSSFTGKSLSNNATYYSRSASYTVRVPAENLDAFLSELGGLINIVDSNSTIDDISAQYYDIISRLNTLNAEKDALTAMYEKATTVDYMLQVQERLYDVIEEIEAFNTQLNFYKNKVAYSTISLNIKEVVEYTETLPEPETFGERIADAFKTSWKNFAEGCKNFAVGFVYAFPTLLVLIVIFGGIGLIVYFIVRKPKRKTPENKNPENK